MITIWDTMIFALSFVAIAAGLLAVCVFVESQVRDFLLRRLDRPLLNKDMADSGITRRELMEQNPYPGYRYKHVIDDKVRDEAMQTVARLIAKRLKADAQQKHEQLVMELGDDVLRGYTEGREA